MRTGTDCGLGQGTQKAQVALSPRAAIQLAAFENGVDPKLMIAIAEVESSMRPKAVGRLGEIGLFQLRPEFFGASASFDPLTNARAAAKHLRWLSQRPNCRVYGKAFFVCHNIGAFRKRHFDNILDNRYYKLVAARMTLSESSAIKTATNADK